MLALDEPTTDARTTSASRSGSHRADAVATCVDKLALRAGDEPRAAPRPADRVGRGTERERRTRAVDRQAPLRARLARRVRGRRSPTSSRGPVAASPSRSCRPGSTGREFTVDLLVDRDGVDRRRDPPLAARDEGRDQHQGPHVRRCPRRRASPRAPWRRSACTGAVNVQGFVDRPTATIWVVEVNPRVSGGLPLTLAAGADVVGELLRATRGLPIRPSASRFAPGVTMTRHLSEVFCCEPPLARPVRDPPRDRQARTRRGRAARRRRRRCGRSPPASTPIPSSPTRSSPTSVSCPTSGGISRPASEADRVGAMLTGAYDELAARATRRGARARRHLHRAALRARGPPLRRPGRAPRGGACARSTPSSVEEGNRRTVARARHAATSRRPTLAARMLEAEGVPRERIEVVGNPVTDSLRRFGPAAVAAGRAPGVRRDGPPSHQRRRSGAPARARGARDRPRATSSAPCASPSIPAPATASTPTGLLDERRRRARGRGARPAALLGDARGRRRRAGRGHRLRWPPGGGVLVRRARRRAARLDPTVGGRPRRDRRRSPGSTRPARSPRRDRSPSRTRWRACAAVPCPYGDGHVGPRVAALPRRSRAFGTRSVIAEPDLASTLPSSVRGAARGDPPPCSSTSTTRSTRSRSWLAGLAGCGRGARRDLGASEAWLHVALVDGRGRGQRPRSDHRPRARSDRAEPISPVAPLVEAFRAHAPDSMLRRTPECRGPRGLRRRARLGLVTDGDPRDPAGQDRRARPRARFDVDRASRRARPGAPQARSRAVPARARAPRHHGRRPRSSSATARPRTSPAPWQRGHACGAGPDRRVRGRGRRAAHLAHRTGRGRGVLHGDRALEQRRSAGSDAGPRAGEQRELPPLPVAVDLGEPDARAANRAASRPATSLFDGSSSVGRRCRAPRGTPSCSAGVGDATCSRLTKTPPGSRTLEHLAVERTLPRVGHSGGSRSSRPPGRTNRGRRQAARRGRARRSRPDRRRRTASRARASISAEKSSPTPTRSGIHCRARGRGCSRRRCRGRAPGARLAGRCSEQRRVPLGAVRDRVPPVQVAPRPLRFRPIG